jgi:hypothetical protein
MTVAQWLSSIVGVVILIAGITFSVWILRRWLKPGNLKRPSGVMVGTMAFLLAWIVVVLAILVWQVFKASRRAHDVRACHVETHVVAA